MKQNTQQACYTAAQDTITSSHTSISSAPEAERILTCRLAKVLPPGSVRVSTALPRATNTRTAPHFVYSLTDVHLSSTFIAAMWQNGRHSGHLWIYECSEGSLHLIATWAMSRHRGVRRLDIDNGEFRGPVPWARSVTGNNALTQNGWCVVSVELVDTVF